MRNFSIIAAIAALAGMGSPQPDRVLTIDRPRLVEAPIRKKGKFAPWIPPGDPDRPTDRHGGPKRRRTKRSVRVAKAKARVAAAKARRLATTGPATRKLEPAP